MRLLVIEDDRALAGLLRRKLLQARHSVDLAYDGTSWPGTGGKRGV